MSHAQTDTFVLQIEISLPVIYISNYFSALVVFICVSVYEVAIIEFCYLASIPSSHLSNSRSWLRNGRDPYFFNVLYLNKFVHVNPHMLHVDISKLNYKRIVR